MQYALIDEQSLSIILYYISANVKMQIQIWSYHSDSHSQIYQNKLERGRSMYQVKKNLIFGSHRKNFFLVSHQKFFDFVSHENLQCQTKIKFF